jgi:hypothetical protein
MLVAPLNHDSDHRFGARGPQHDAPVWAEFSFDMTNGGTNRLAF